MLNTFMLEQNGDKQKAHKAFMEFWGQFEKLKSSQDATVSSHSSESADEDNELRPAPANAKFEGEYAFSEFFSSRANDIMVGVRSTPTSIDAAKSSFHTHTQKDKDERKVKEIRKSVMRVNLQ